MGVEWSTRVDGDREGGGSEAARGTPTSEEESGLVSSVFRGGEESEGVGGGDTDFHKFSQ